LTTTFDDAIFQYISESAQISETTIANLVNLVGYVGTPTPEMYNADRAFYSIVQNGMNEIRAKSESIESTIVSFYQNEFWWTKINVIIATVVGLTLVIVAATLLGIIVSKVMVRNELVLTLFARINTSDIKRLCEKCEHFLKTRLSERVTDYTEAEDVKDSKENLGEDDKDKSGDQKDEELQPLDGENDGDYDMQTEKPGLVGGGQIGNNSQQESQKGINTSNNGSQLMDSPGNKKKGAKFQSEVVGATNFSGSMNNSDGPMLLESTKKNGKYQSDFMGTKGSGVGSGDSQGQKKLSGFKDEKNMNSVPKPSRQTKAQMTMDTKKSMHQQALEQKKEDEENEDVYEQRVNKLVNSKTSGRNKVIGNFVCISILILLP
jgi:hypothetical protein